MAYTTINKGSSYFTPKFYTGTGATQSITDLEFKPDWVWMKSRSYSDSGALYDIVRGVQKQLIVSDTSAETTQTTGLTSFNSDGFTIGTLSTINTSSETYDSWNWLASNTTTTNTNGSITSTVSVNQTSGFSIVSYTGNTTAGATIGHGLGKIPQMIIVKNRNSVVDYRVYNEALGNTKRLNFNDNTAVVTDSTVWNNTSPTSTVFTVGTSTTTNSNNLIAYCFANIKGYSQFGSYTGNGNTNGPFIYTGFKPAFVIIKRYSSVGNWITFDNKLDTYNLTKNYLQVDVPNGVTVGTTNVIDIISNGFKLRGTNVDINNLSNLYIYMTFAENPFVTTSGVPVTAR